MKTKKYYVDGYNYFAETLSELRCHIYNECDSDKKRYNGNYVSNTDDPGFWRIVRIKGKRVVFARK